MLSIRRPFLVGAHLRSAAAQARTDWSTTLTTCEKIDPVTREWLASAWLKDALEEHASVAAFARFTLHLLSLGAPAHLVMQSQRASLDEIQHAKMCFGLAARYGQHSQGPAALPLDGAFAVSSFEDIVRLAAEEGCVGETLGALLAREQLTMATDPAVVQVLERIQRDEQRHAELSWQFVAWAIKMGGPAIARTVQESILHACGATLNAPVKRYEHIDPVSWRAHGRVTCEEARGLASAGIDEIIRPALTTLLGGTPERATDSHEAGERFSASG